jgi:predicted small lipoprotein YifL
MAMGRALRLLITLALLLGLGLTACGRRGSLESPPPSTPQVKADPATKMSRVPDRPLIIDRLLQ